MNNIEKMNQFLDRAGVWFLLTTDGEQPKGRPFRFHLLKDNRLYFGTGTFKNVYKQLKKNAYVEILAVDKDQFLRYDGKVVFEKDELLANEVLKANPQFQAIYNEQTGMKLGMFHLEEGKAEICSAMGQKESFIV